MKTKSLVKTLFWTLFLVYTYQFSLIIPTHIIESSASTQAAIYAKQFPLAQQTQKKIQYEQNYLDAVSNKVLFSIPYVMDYTYNSLKKQQLQLGLDLKGGMQITIGLDAGNFIKNLSNHSKDPNFLHALAQTKERKALTLNEGIIFFFNTYTELENKEKIIQLFSSNIQIKERLGNSVSLTHLKAIIIQLSQETLNQTQLLLTHRTNGLGLGQVSISKDLENQYIRMEIPGVKNPERIRETLLATASLEFWDTYSITDNSIMDGLKKANELYKKNQSL